MWEIRRYKSEMRDEWDAFVKIARNATFLFRRSYMDYHSDRFKDHSLLAYRNGKLSAILPANIEDLTLWSHKGLTYGGWVWKDTGLDTTTIFHLWKTWLEWCGDNGIKKIVYKPLPYVYSIMPSQEDLYMLFICGAVLLQSDISNTIDLINNPGFNKLQKRHLKKVPEEFYIDTFDGRDTDDIKEFHDMTVECLQDRHGRSPVHSYEELLYLSQTNREIVFWGVFSDDTQEMQGGVCIYETEICAHCQYIATTPRGREANALSFLFEYLIDLYTDADFRYFDFGTSNENGGRYLNEGLNRQKTSYGGSGVAYQRYEINVSSALAQLPTELWPPKK